MGTAPETCRSTANGLLPEVDTQADAPARLAYPPTMNPQTSEPTARAAAAGPDARLAAEVARRRTMAIISHPDAGKTTLTEKLLLYGGAIHLAGSVKARRAARHVTSDWMELERQRGISVTSSVMAFDYNGYRINLLDTPGHQDFSEDTYRTLVAADSAVMLLDNRKGVEERTRQLFAVCKRRRMPIFTFVNKCDRAGENPLKLLSDVEAELGIDCYPVTWPVFANSGFAGVYDRRTKKVTLFERTEDHGASIAHTLVFDMDTPELLEIVGAEGIAQLADEVSLLDEAGHQWSREALLDGSMTPVHFGSALTNFGVEAFLQDFLALAPPPTARESTTGPIEPTRPEFTGFVFKIQANMDPRHRDRIAFVRICSGHFEPGIEVEHVRTGKTLRLSAAQQLMGRERTGVEEAWAGDVIGVIDRGALRIGDTLSQAGDLEFQGIPRFPPEHFARVVPRRPPSPEAPRHRTPRTLGRRRGPGVLPRWGRWPDTHRGSRRPAAVRRHDVPAPARVRSALPHRADRVPLSPLGGRSAGGDRPRCGSGWPAAPV